MTARPRIAARLRVLALATVLAATSFAVTATPATAPTGDDPLAGLARTLGELAAPRKALAAFCADNPGFTGRLTASSSSTAAVTRITNPLVYGYISNVDDDWSCTAYFRFSGIAWNTTATKGYFDWGNLINSTSVACNFVIDSTDYVKGNATTDCPDSDAEYALDVSFTAEREYRADASHDDVGDFSFVHADCGSYYGGDDGEKMRGGEGTAAEGFAGSNVDNRPGANCDPLTIDGTNTGQTITYDNTVPEIGFDTPDEGAGLATVGSAAYTVAFDAYDATAKFGGGNGWTLSRQIAPWDGTACGTFTADAGAGAIVTGTTSAYDQTSPQYLTSDACYRWTLAATDQNGKSAGPITSGVVRRDAASLLGSEGYQAFESWDLGAGDDLSVNVETGNVVVSHPVVSLPIRGGSLDLSLAYNSQDTTNWGMGPGWRLNVLRRLTVDPATGDVTFTDGDGSRHVFDWNGSAYVRPATLYATLVRDTGATPDRFTLTYRDQTKDVFDEFAANTGYLVAERDRFGSAVTFTYSGTNLATATDPAGRTVSFTWDTAPTPDRLTSITDWANVSGGVVQASGSGNRTHRFFYDGTSGRLTGWADPLNTTGSCATQASHLTCFTYAAGTAALVTAISKTQTYETVGASALGTGTRTITTSLAYRGGDVDSVTDAAGAQTTFSRPADGQTLVERPGTPASETKYGLANPGDSLARVQSVWRLADANPDTWIEQRTAWDTTYPTEPASVTENYVDGTPSDTAPDEDRTTTYAYVASSMGLLSRLTEPLTASTHRTTDYTYNANNDVTVTTVALDGSGTVRTITRNCYNPNLNLCGSADADLRLYKTVANWTDGAAGNGAANVEDGTTTFAYDAYGQRTRETRLNYRADGTLLDQAATGWTYDSHGNLTAEIRNYADGDVTSPGDDITPNGTANARTDLTTTYTYDTAGNRITIADPRRAILAATGSPDPDDYRTTFTFDPLGQQLSETTPTTPGISITQKTATSVYDELGNVREATDFGGLITGTEYDEAGRATKTFEDAASTNPDVTSETTYDAAGRVLATKDRRQVDTASLGVTATTYDELGRVTSVSEAQGSSPDVATVTATTYDDLDRVLTEDTGDATATEQRTSYTYDLGSRVLRTDDEFTCTTKAYDYRDLLTGDSQGLEPGTCGGTAQRVISRGYDGLGRLTLSEITAGESDGDVVEASTYDAAGRQLSTSATRVGVTTASAFAFNPLDEVVAETRAEGDTAVSWTKTNYDPAGNPTDRCIWSTDPADEGCHAVGEAFETDPDLHTSTGLDARNNRVSLKLPALGETTYDPDHNYQVAAAYLPTGSGKELQTLYHYDERHRVAGDQGVPGIVHQLCTINSGHACSTTVALGSDDYQYDDNDNRTQVEESRAGGTATTLNYCYDGLNRLRAMKAGTACSLSSGDELFEYDDAGNRRKVVAGSTTWFRYSGAGQLCQSGAADGSCLADPATWQLRYDDTGRTSFWNGWHLAYDGEGRLASACKVGGCATGDMVTMRYDGEGRRVELVVRPNGGTATTTTFRYQSGAIAQELVDGTLARSYLTDEAGRIVKVCDPACEGTNPQYLVTWSSHGDALALWQIDAGGSLTLANSFGYSTWGTPTVYDASGTPIAWTDAASLRFRFLYVGAYGVAWDDLGLGLGLEYMSARHYSPALGRFLQPDPSAAEANLYGYAGENPVTNVDPSGLAGPGGRPGHQLYYRFVASWGPSSPPQVISYVVGIGTSIGCALKAGGLPAPWAKGVGVFGCAVLSGAASWVATWGNPGGRRVHEIWLTTSGRVLDIHRDTRTGGRTRAYSFTYSTGGGIRGARRCAACILGRTSPYAFSLVCGRPIAVSNKSY